MNLIMEVCYLRFIETRDKLICVLQKLLNLDGCVQGRGNGDCNAPQNLPKFILMYIIIFQQIIGFDSILFQIRRFCHFYALTHDTISLLKQNEPITTDYFYRLHVHTLYSILRSITSNVADQ